MTKHNGHSNSQNNGHDDGNVTSFEEAKKRAAEKAKAEKRAAVSAGGPRTLRDWIIGWAIIAVAVAYLVHLIMKATQNVAGGA